MRSSSSFVNPLFKFPDNIKENDQLFYAKQMRDFWTNTYETLQAGQKSKSSRMIEVMEIRKEEPQTKKRGMTVDNVASSLRLSIEKDGVILKDKENNVDHGGQKTGILRASFVSRKIDVNKNLASKIFSNNNTLIKSNLMVTVVLMLILQGGI